MWKVYEKNASSTVVRVSKVSELNGNLMILNFLDTAESSFLAVLHPYHFFPQTFYIVVVARPCGSCHTQEKNSFSQPIFHFDIGERRCVISALYQDHMFVESMLSKTIKRLGTVGPQSGVYPYRTFISLVTYPFPRLSMP